MERKCSAEAVMMTNVEKTGVAHAWLLAGLVAGLAAILLTQRAADVMAIDALTALAWCGRAPHDAAAFTLAGHCLYCAPAMLAYGLSAVAFARGAHAWGRARRAAVKAKA
jgi:hypothetical protein